MEQGGVARYLGLDFGGTKLALGVADGNGRLIAQRRCPTVAALGAPGAIAAMVKLADEIGVKGADLDGVGVSFGDPVDLARRMWSVFSAR